MIWYSRAKKKKKESNSIMVKYGFPNGQEDEDEPVQN